MSDLKDAKIFLEPMDPLKYAVSYSCHFIFAFVLGIPHTTTVTLNPFLASNSQN